VKQFVAIALPGIIFFAMPAASQDNVLPDGILQSLLKAEQLELLSLLPEPEKVKPKDHFHGFTVLGKTVVKDAAARKNLVETFKKGMAGEINPAKCFDPRHGIRVIQDGKKIDLVICFACAQFYVHDASGNAKKYLVGNSPEPLFDKVLKDAGFDRPK